MQRALASMLNQFQTDLRWILKSEQKLFVKTDSGIHFKGINFAGNFLEKSLNSSSEMIIAIGGRHRK